MNSLAELLFNLGLRFAVISPGSRSGPISESFYSFKGFTTFVISDERSAGFVALGIAKSINSPVAVICTSGSAVLNLSPAVSEAYHSQIPLLLITADRPPEWIGQGDGQTIDQYNAFGKLTKTFINLPANPYSADDSWFIGREVSNAFNISNAFPKGPVQINVPLRELSFPPNLPKLTPIKLSSVHNEAQNIIDAVSKNLLGKKIMLYPGVANPDIEEKNAVEAFIEKYSAVLLSDAISNFNFLTEKGKAITLHDLFDLDALTHPDLIITWGGQVLSKKVKQYLRKADCEHWHLSAQGLNQAPDVFKHLSNIINIEPQTFFEKVNSYYPESDAKLKKWQSEWKQSEKEAQEKILSQIHDYWEFNALNYLLKNLNGDWIVHFANSLPVRYANLLQLKSWKNLSLYANRGVSGIDGCTGTALGHALANRDKNVLLVTGDQAALYDFGSLANRYLPLNLKIIVLNNNGGGIFRVINKSAKNPLCEQIYAAPQQLKVSPIASALGYKTFTVNSFSDIDTEAINLLNEKNQGSLLEIITDPNRNATAYRQLLNLD